MKKILIPILILLTISCKKDIVNLKQVSIDNIPQIKIDTTKPTINKVGFVIDTIWFKKNYPGFSIATHNGKGEGDFNKDGKKDLVVMFATNSEAKYLFQKDTSNRVVVGVFINHKTYFELDTNLVYSYLGGYSDISVADINSDSYLDIYQMTGYWEGSQYPKPTYYNNSGHGGMDSYVYLNDNNKSLKRYTLPIQNDAGSTTSIIFDNNKNGFSEIYLSSCLCYFEFNGNSFIRNELSLDKNFKNQSYNLRVITPKYAEKNIGMIFISENIFGESYFILKLENDKLIPKIKFKPKYPNSGPPQEIDIEDLDNDGKLEYIIPMWISENSNNTIPAIPYLMIVDENGNDVSNKYMDSELTNPLTYEQINWIGETWQTGFIYHTFADVDNDGIKEIFPASGVGYKKGNDTYYYKLIDGKYKLQFYHSGWLGDVHKSKGYINYKPFVDEKNGVNLFLTIEFDLYKSIFKTF
jgi:hypothetical protein